MSEPLVVADSLGKSYGSPGRETVALAHASFRVEPRARIALVGPSGSGKSTLLHLVAAIDEPTSGRIEWPGLGRRDELRPGPVAMAFQGPSLLPPLTVAENVALPLLLERVPERDALQRAGALLDELGLSAIADKLPEELSGGQSQRAGLARALVSDPVLVLADEPTGQLDHEHAQRLMDTLLAKAAETGMAVIVATHDELIAGRMDERWRIDSGVLETGARHG